MKTQSPSGSRGRAGVRISNLPPWLSLLCMVIYIKEEPTTQVRALKTLDISYSHSMALYLSSRHSSCTQFSVPSRDECRQVTPCRVSSASGTKAGTTPKTFFKLKGIEFLFLSQRARRTAFGGSISPKTPVLKLNRPLACKPPASTASESALVAFEPSEKPQVTGLWYRWAK